MSIIDDNLELNKILESVNWDKYELIDLPMEQLDGSSHEHMVIGSCFGYGKYVWGGTLWRDFNGTAFGSWPMPGVFFVFPVTDKQLHGTWKMAAKIRCSKNLLQLKFSSV